jgi:hypothetical protein
MGYSIPDLISLDVAIEMRNSVSIPTMIQKNVGDIRASLV